MSNIADMRVIYQPQNPISVDELPSRDPMKLFDVWFNEARACKSVEEPNAMTVATATKDGVPSARVCLLKGYDESYFKFYTNYNSRKGQELAVNPNIALVFYWEPLHKSVRVEGTVEKLSTSESESYFNSRPHGSQIGASVSNQSQPISSKQVLLDRFEVLKEKYPTEEHKVDKPKDWGGYAVTPKVMEFWQGEPNRLHNRIQFFKDASDVKSTLESAVHKGENNWLFQLLSP